MYVYLRHYVPHILHASFEQYILSTFIALVSQGDVTFSSNQSFSTSLDLPITLSES